MNRQTRIPGPIARIGNTWLFPGGKRLPIVSGGATGDEEPDPEADPNADPAANAEADAITIPEDLTDREAVSDDDLGSLEEALVKEFDAELEHGTRDVAKMTQLAEAIESVRVEQDRRVEQDAADAQAIDDLAKRIKGSDDPAPEGDPEPTGDEPPAEDDDGAKAKKAKEPKQPALANAGTKEPVTAGATPRGGKPSARSISRNAPPASPPAKQPEPGELVAITAAAGLPSAGNGDTLTVAGVAQAFHDQARGLKDGVKGSKVATVHRPGLTMVSGDATAALDAIVAAGLQNGAQGLVAAGGWCLPSQVYFDMFAIEGTDALFDLPTIGVEGGGVNVPSFIGYDAANNSLWVWTEDVDEAALTPLSATDIDVAGGTMTITATGHGLVAGIPFTLDASDNTIDGSYTVTAVTDANTFTVTGVSGTISNATGTILLRKGCMRIPCPTWTEYRLGADGLCITHGNLTDRAFPQLGTRYVNLAMAAHERRIASRALTALIATIDAGNKITITDQGSDSVGEELSAIDLAVMGYKSQYGMGENDVLEAVFPLWARQELRATLARRAGVDLLDVPNSRINQWFTDRNVRPQFVRDYQELYASATIPLAWPSTLKFLLYPAGGYFKGTGGEVNLGTQRDSVLNATNDFTLAWTEEFWLLGQRGPDAREVTVALNDDGVTACCA